MARSLSSLAATSYPANNLPDPISMSHPIALGVAGLLLLIFLLPGVLNVLAYIRFRSNSAHPASAISRQPVAP